MGMFDSVFIDARHLPVSAEDRHRLDEMEFQTKDLDCGLYKFYITDAGRLERMEFVRENGRRIYTGRKDTGFDGILDFYAAAENEDWFEFIAIFKKGDLVSVQQVKEDYRFENPL